MEANRNILDDSIKEKHSSEGLRSSTQKHPGGLFTVGFMLLSVTFAVCLVTSNLMEIKTVDLGWFTITAGVVVFPLSYIINDCVVEVYGFRKARFMIWVGFFMSLLVAGFLQLALWLPGGDAWHSQDAMEQIYGNVPRIMVASFAAFLCGSMVNAQIMSRMKAVASVEHRTSAVGFSLRAIISTLFGEGVDSAIFFPVAFGGIFPWTTILSLMVTQALLKTVYEIMILPVTILVVRKLKRVEASDITDTHVNYKWWRIFEID